MKMKKDTKKYILTAIAINLLSIAYGTILNFVWQGENVSILFAYVEGILVGFLVTFIYCIMTFILGHGLEEKEFHDKYAKWIITFMNTVAILLTWVGITALIGSVEWIALDYAWIYIANVFFSGLVVVKANYDGRKIRQTLSKNNEVKNIVKELNSFAEPTDKVV